MYRAFNVILNSNEYIRTTERESIIISSSLPTEPIMPTRSWYESMQRRAPRKCLKAVNASLPPTPTHRPFTRT